MPFSPFTAEDFNLIEQVNYKAIPQLLEDKISNLRQDLANYPEFQLDFFSKRIVRRPKMRGSEGLVFGPPRSGDKHWYLFNVGGDQDQVQLNIAMWPEYMRVGLGFQIGRQISPKIPAFHLLQTFLGVRPPLPFRDAFLKCIERNGFGIEDRGERLKIKDANEIIYKIETYVVPADVEPIFVFIGKLWNIEEVVQKTLEDYRKVFLELIPFYEGIILMGGRFAFYP